jgi:hypothetical protein
MDLHLLEGEEMRTTIDMAREAGYMRTVHGGAEISMASMDCLKAFEALVRADERAIAAPVQEPVAWMYEDMMGLVGVRVQKEKPIVARPVTPLCLCTPPAAQRQWVGLTDEEMYLNCPNWLSQEHCKTWLQQIEAKLKEKNT